MVINTDLAALAPVMKISDFFSGICKIFNLTCYATSANTYQLEPLDNWYSQGAIVDISRFTDVDTIDVDKMKLYKKITMKYQFELEKKKFDAYIPELKILIEFQEDAKNHDNSESDTHKRLIAKMNGYYIMYFQEEELKKSDKNLRIYFENTFKKILYGAISYYKKEETMPLVRKLYVDKLRQDKIKIQGMVINNKSERIKIIDHSIKSFEGNEAMEKLMEK
jgi:very-short-patch-repair endonuclease